MYRAIHLHVVLYRIPDHGESRVFSHSLFFSGGSDHHIEQVKLSVQTVLIRLHVHFVLLAFLLKSEGRGFLHGPVHVIVAVNLITVRRVYDFIVINRHGNGFAKWVESATPQEIVWFMCRNISPIRRAAGISDHVRAFL